MHDVAFDSELQAARQGDPDALSRLLLRYGPEVRASLSIQAHWRTVIDPDDIMQVTYTEAFLRIGAFTSAHPDAFLGWLRLLAQNNLRDAIRGLEAQKRPNPRRRVQGAGDGYSALVAVLGVTTSTPSRAAALEDIRAAVEQALAMLPRDYADAVRLIDLEGLSSKEAGERLGRSAAAAVMLAVRGRERLREVLGSDTRFFSSSP